MSLYKSLSLPDLTAAPTRSRKGPRWSTRSVPDIQWPDEMATTKNKFARIGRQEQLAGESSLRVSNRVGQQSEVLEALRDQ